MGKRAPYAGWIPLKASKAASVRPGFSRLGFALTQNSAASRAAVKLTHRQNVIKIRMPVSSNAMMKVNPWKPNLLKKDSTGSTIFF